MLFNLILRPFALIVEIFAGVTSRMSLPVLLHKTVAATFWVEAVRNGDSGSYAQKQWPINQRTTRCYCFIIINLMGNDPFCSGDGNINPDADHVTFADLRYVVVWVLGGLFFSGSVNRCLIS